MDEKNISFFRFEDLRVYGKAIDYSKWLLGALKEPTTYGGRMLSESFVSSATCISLNIAEGSSRNKSHFDHYLKISKAYIRECIAYTSIAAGIGLLDEEACEQSRTLLMELTRMVGALIISLQRPNRHREGVDSASYGDDYADMGQAPSFDDFTEGED